VPSLSFIVSPSVIEVMVMLAWVGAKVSVSNAVSVASKSRRMWKG
jgi:hypothetical protein